MIDKHKSRIIAGLFCAVILLLSMVLSACSPSDGSAEEAGEPNAGQPSSGILEPSASATSQEATAVAPESPAASQNPNGRSKTPIVYFSRVGVSESFDDVDAVSSASLPDGNTTIIAKMIAAATGGELFQIVTEKLYPAGNVTWEARHIDNN